MIAIESPWRHVCCITSRGLLAPCISVVLACWCGQAGAQSTDEGWSLKLTPSVYRNSAERDAADLNLRANDGQHAVWIGHYVQQGVFEQTRVGYEGVFETPFGLVQPSVQLASHGFVGGSINAQIGGDVYLIAGLGRTNLRPYYNLNFDPNDAVTLGVGTRRIANTQLSFFVVRDDRLHTGQTIAHWVWRYTPKPHHRWTVDLSYKRGRPAVDEPRVRGWGLSVTRDFENWFLRLGIDQNVNFSTQDQARIALGFRF